MNYLTESLKKRLQRLAWLISLSFISYFLFTHFLLQVIIVEGRSMLPTLQEGQTYLLNRLALRCRPPQRDELVVIRDPGHSDWAVKRIVAVPGDSVLFKQGEVYVNGTKRSESFLLRGVKTYCADAPQVLYMVGRHRYFVMGDNRVWSEDSRTYGAVHRSQVLGVLVGTKTAQAPAKSKSDFSTLRRVAALFKVLPPPLTGPAPSPLEVGQG